MMFWNGGWAWVFMVPMMVVIWSVIALVLLPWMRTGRQRPRSAIEILDDRLAAGEIDVDEYRSRCSELERRTPV